DVALVFRSGWSHGRLFLASLAGHVPGQLCQTRPSRNSTLFRVSRASFLDQIKRSCWIRVQGTSPEVFPQL
ncbi:unnamed protein product, partial [Nesidiocoris tenuis]